MSPTPSKLPSGNASASASASAVPIRTTVDLGVIVRQRRRKLALNQVDLAGLGNTGNRFIVDVENGKPTVQFQKVLDLMDLLGLEVVVRAKASQPL